MLPGRKFIGLAVAACCAGGCASTPGDAPKPIASSSAQPPAAQASAAPTAGGYTLTPEELALDCKKITGRMQVRILQIRDYAERPGSTGFSHVMQTATTSVLGGTKEGTDPESRYARDRAVLEAYNGRLAEKGCPTFNLVAELKPKSVMETPRPGKAADANASKSE